MMSAKNPIKTNFKFFSEFGIYWPGLKQTARRLAQSTRDKKLGLSRVTEAIRARRSRSSVDKFLALDLP